MKSLKQNSIKIPDPLILALLLTLLTMVLAFSLGSNSGPGLEGVTDVIIWWNQGIWDLLSFTMQMVLILLLGYMLALSTVFGRLSTALTSLAKNPLAAAITVSVTAVILGLLNWGLALVFGAVFVRKIAIQAVKNGNPINYPLLGAAAYTSMMVWHGGLSGSAPLSVASSAHFLIEKTGVIGLSETIFSPMNLLTALSLLLILPLATWFLARNSINSIPALNLDQNELSQEKDSQQSYSRVTLLSFFGFLLLAGYILRIIMSDKASNFGLNEINIILLALVLIFLPSVKQLSEAAQTAASSTVGIMLQFPIYAGIMGLMNHSGLLNVMTQWFINISTPETFSVYAFFSASLVNLFVPSGGGQWAVQGPMIIDSALALGVPPPKAVMALAYGDQLTNMLQPFWALPLLAITGLKAGQILKYAVIYMLIGFAVFTFFLAIM